MKPKKVKGYFCDECGEFTEADGLPVQSEGWLCDGSEQVTLTAPAREEGMSCPHCGDFIAGATPEDGKKETREVCEHCEDDLQVNEHEKCDAWELDCGCVVTEEPSLVDAFACSECEEAHEERDDAKDCCKE
jgi:hypothetical protein